MQFQRNMMRHRVARRFARTTREQGDSVPPAFYEVPISAGAWGQPWAKAKDGDAQCLFLGLIVFPFLIYNFVDLWALTHTRTMTPGIMALYHGFIYRFTDMDDPDHAIKYEKIQEEAASGITQPGWFGANYYAAYLWEPGDPEPDPRRKHNVGHGHH